MTSDMGGGGCPVMHGSHTNHAMGTRNMDCGPNALTNILHQHDVKTNPSAWTLTTRPLSPV